VLTPVIFILPHFDCLLGGMSKKSEQSPIDAPRRYSKAKPLATKIGVCTKSLFRWADEGLISRFKLNARLVLFDEAEVERYIQSSRVRS